VSPASSSLSPLVLTPAVASESEAASPVGDGVGVVPGGGSEGGAGGDDDDDDAGPCDALLLAPVSAFGRSGCSSAAGILLLLLLLLLLPPPLPLPLPAPAAPAPLPPPPGLLVGELPM
jgi:hypothetical protein